MKAANLKNNTELTIKVEGSPTRVTDELQFKNPGEAHTVTVRSVPRSSMHILVRLSSS